MIVKISTDGKFLIVGKLNFAADNISISGRLYADLSKVAERLGDRAVPGRRPRPGPAADDLRQAQDGLQNAVGRGVAFDVVNLPPATPGSTEADRHGRRTRRPPGGSADLNTIAHAQLLRRRLLGRGRAATSTSARSSTATRTRRSR